MEMLKSGVQKLGLQLTPQQLEQFEVYYRELISWNKRVNLTAITSYEEAQVKHFLDSLTVIEAIRPVNAVKSLNIIDVGSGAGFPGLPLKIVFPEIKLTLLEATAKKTQFLKHLVARLGLNDIEIVAGRAEEIAHRPQYRQKFDLVLSRAVATLPALVELTLPFSAIGGTFIAQKKGDIREEIEEAQQAIETMGGRLRETRPIKLKETDDERCLVVIDKVKATPEKYPRRPGMPEKRPLIF